MRRLKFAASLILVLGFVILFPFGKTVNAQTAGTSALDPLRGEFDKIKADSRYIGATIYNVFATNNNDGSLTDSQLQYLCRGACGIIGANAANFYPMDGGFYSHAKNLGMLFTLAIARNNPGDVEAGLNAALSNGEAPIIRLGVHSDVDTFCPVHDADGTCNPQTYIDFLHVIDLWANNSYPGSTIYAIAGSNEPETEFWVTPNCGITDSTCIGRGLAKYMNGVIAGAGNLQHVKLLSPAFNMTDAAMPPIVKAMSQYGANWGGVVAIAGNSYNLQGKLVTAWVDDFLAASGLGSNHKIFLTETGDFNITSGTSGAPAKPYNLQQVPCTGNPTTTDPEFHSLRPYPASPCYKEIKQTAWMCANSLVAKSSYHFDTPPAGSNCTSTTDANGVQTQTCTLNLKAEQVGVTVNLGNAKLPVLGNTEDVPHAGADSTSNGLSAAQRMNNYVSWYLNGVLGRAEEDFPNYDSNYLVNFSGPLNKLLPLTVDYIARIVSVDNAQQTANGAKNLINDPTARHNQLVGCISEVKTSGGVLGGLFGSGYLALSPCYLESVGINIVEQILGLGGPRKRLTDLNDHKPPLEKDFANFPDFWKAYLQWIGSTCSANLPGTQYYVCVVDNFKSVTLGNVWSKIFPNVPLSNTEDRVGEVFTDKTVTTSPGITTLEHTDQVNQTEVTNVSFTPSGDSVQDNCDPATEGCAARHNLYFSHTQEVAELAKQLQGTFATKPDPADTNNWEKQLADDIRQHDLDQGGQLGTPVQNCEQVKTFTNSGDKLYGDQQAAPFNEKQITGNLKYDTTFTCTFKSSVDQNGIATCIAAGGDPTTCIAQNSKVTPCTHDVFVSMSMFTKVPNIQEDWDRLVNGAASIFKRFWPLTGPEDSIATLKDIPGVTTVGYTAQGGGANNTVSALAGDPNASRDGGQAQLFFPHLGSIDQYFLKDIQKALRPEQCVSTVADSPPSTTPQAGPTTLTQVSGGQGGWLITTDANADNLVASQPGDYGQATCAWGQSNGLAYSINANFGRSNGTTPIGPIGSGGNITNYAIVGSKNDYKSFYIDANGPHIGSVPDNLTGIKFIVTGVLAINAEFPSHLGPEPRTILGLNGNKLYLMALNATTPDGARAAMMAAGATDTIMLDSDTSTNLCESGTLKVPSNGSRGNPATNMGIKTSISTPLGSSVCVPPGGGPITTTPIVPPGSCQINCDQSIPDSAIPAVYLKFKDHVIDLADRWVGRTGKSYAKECYNDVIKTSIDRGINPVFSLAIWLHESGASNYTSRVTSCITQDFGINGGGVPPSNFSAQLSFFLGLPTSYKTNHPQCFTSTYTPMQNFIHIYRSGANTNSSGVCGPTIGDLNYDSDIKEIWGLITNGYTNFCAYPDYPTNGTCN